MPDYLVTLLGALIGALIGSIGAVFAEFWLSGRAKDKLARKQLAQKYLYQIQDATESLWYRIDNLAVWHRELRNDGYFELTTLYVLGRVLASERIVGLDGIYPLLNDAYPGLNDVLRNRIDGAMKKLGLMQYDRITLAESLIESEGGRFRLYNYLEFRRNYEADNAPEREWLDPARSAIRSLSNENVRQSVSELLYKVANEISKEIGVNTSLPKLPG